MKICVCSITHWRSGQWTEPNYGQNLIMERILMRKEQISLRQIGLGKSPCKLQFMSNSNCDRI